MRTHTKIAAGSTVAGIAAVIAVVVACPEVAATREGYFDMSSGRMKVQYTSFGRVYHESVMETQYSELLRGLGFGEDPPDWRPAYTEELGIRRWMKPQHVSYPYGKIAADACMFAQWVELNGLGPDRTRDETVRFRQLLRQGDWWQVKQHLATLQHAAATVRTE